MVLFYNTQVQLQEFEIKTSKTINKVRNYRLVLTNCAFEIFDSRLVLTLFRFIFLGNRQMMIKFKINFSRSSKMKKIRVSCFFLHTSPKISNSIKNHKNRLVEMIEKYLQIWK